jgi:hydrogenase nickel incorporation protein HypB
MRQPLLSQEADMNAPVIDKRFHDLNPVARLNRDVLREAGVLTVNVLGGPGCGKTSLITATIDRLLPDVNAGVIACDIGSRRDADRIARSSQQVVQVNTGPGGVVEASDIHDALQWLDLQSLDLLFIENVGTLAPSGIADLGQDAAAVVFSVAGGDDKADKHPDLVRAAGVVILNKIDLLVSVPFDLPAFESDVRGLNPRVELIEVSALRGDGIERWVHWLKSRVTGGTQKASHWFG